MSKKLISLILSLSLVASLFACIPMSAAAAVPEAAGKTWGANGENTVETKFWIGAGDSGCQVVDLAASTTAANADVADYTQLNYGVAFKGLGKKALMAALRGPIPEAMRLTTLSPQHRANL